MSLFFMLLLAVGLILYVAFSWGFVSYVLYGWYILPIWPTLQHFTILQFIGIQLFVECFVRRSRVHVKKELKDNADALKTTFMAPWIALMIAGFLKLLFFN